MTSSYPVKGRPAFSLDHNGWPKNATLGNLLSLRRDLVDLTFVLTLESEMELRFLHSLCLFSKCKPKTILVA